MDFTTPSAGDREVTEPPPKPDGGGSGGQIGPRINRTVDVADEFPEFGTVDLTAVPGGIENRHSMVASIPDTDQERHGKIDSEDVKADSLGDRAIGEGSRHRKARHAGQHQIEIHGIRVEGDLLFASKSEFDEKGLVQVGEKSVHAASILRVSPPGKVRHAASNLLCERIESSLSRGRIEVGSTMSAQCQHRPYEIPVAIKFRQRSTVS